MASPDPAEQDRAALLAASLPEPLQQAFSQNRKPASSAESAGSASHGVQSPEPPSTAPTQLRPGPVRRRMTVSQRFTFIEKQVVETHKTIFDQRNLLFDERQRAFEDQMAIRGKADLEDRQKRATHSSSCLEVQQKLFGALGGARRALHEHLAREGHRSRALAQCEPERADRLVSFGEQEIALDAEGEQVSQSRAHTLFSERVPGAPSPRLLAIQRPAVQPHRTLVALVTPREAVLLRPVGFGGGVLAWGDTLGAPRIRANDLPEVGTSQRDVGAETLGRHPVTGSRPGDGVGTVDRRIQELQHKANANAATLIHNYRRVSRLTGDQRKMRAG